MGKKIILIAGQIKQERVKKVPDVQKILTDYGYNIKTRLGLHDVSKSVCSALGLLLLDTYSDEAKILEMEKKLKKVTGLVVKKMTFEMYVIFIFCDLRRSNIISLICFLFLGKDQIIILNSSM